jgi:two-component system, NarL family, invasion response regulator UvrY
MIRVGLVDDHAVVRAGLKQYLSEHVDLRVTGEASNGAQAMELAREGEIDVLLMDISMPDQSGVDALKAIKARFPDLAVLILSGFPEAHYATNLLRLGASGYLNKECEPEEIVNAIRTVSMGRKYISQAVASLLAEGAAGGLERPPHERDGGGHGRGHVLEREDSEHLPHACAGKAQPLQQQRSHVLRHDQRPDPVTSAAAWS